MQNADITLNGTMELLNNGLGWANSAAGAFRMGALNGTGTMVGNFNGVGGVTTVTVGATNNAGTFSGTIADGVNNTVHLVKTGSGTQTLSGANTYTGTTTVTGGTLTVSGSLSGTTAVNVNAGTLLLGASNAINDAAAMNLGGGTFNTGGFSDTLGALTLTANSTIDFGAGSASELTFTTLTLGATNNLNIWNWTTTNGLGADPGTAGDGLRDRLLFTTLGTLSAGELSRIHFFSDGGFTGLGDGGQISFGGNQEIVPVPEPSTLAAALGLLGLAVCRERRHFLRKRVA